MFGIEGIAADEFRRMGFEEVSAQNGRVILNGGYDMLFRDYSLSEITGGEFEAK